MKILKCGRADRDRFRQALMRLGLPDVDAWEWEETGFLPPGNAVILGETPGEHELRPLIALLWLDDEGTLKVLVPTVSPSGTIRNWSQKHPSQL